MGKPMVFRLIIAVNLVLLALSGCGEDSAENAYRISPSQTGDVVLTANGHVVEPLRMELMGDTLYVVARGFDRVLLYSADTFENLGDIVLRTTPTISPSALAVTKDAIAVGDHARGIVALFDHSGEFQEAFGLMPDGETELSPMSMTEFGGVLYIADVSSKRVLAVSIVNAEGLTEPGELILSIPMEDRAALGFPSAVLVTPDGRLLVGDAQDGGVRVFTCDGRSIYSFEPTPGAKTAAPQALAFDTIQDPSLQDEGSFDPSGVRGLGRIHMVDGMNGRIHMFNPLGKYVSSYPHEDQRLAGPSDIVIDPVRKRIIVCDPPASRLVTFSYGGTT